MRRLLELTGNPHRQLRVVHVAGTKGKGSTVAMIAAMLRESGHRVGRYMSPHVHRLEERIAVNGRLISENDLVGVWEIVRPAVERMDAQATRRGRHGPSWFEILTALAFVHFRHQSVDIAVLETGLGGRLDATNVVQPVLSVITSISLDHMAQLGPTVGHIAREKAGIIKRGRPVLCGARDPEARSVIAAVATSRRSRLLQIGQDFEVQATPRPCGPGDVPRLAVRIVPADGGRCVLTGKLARPRRAYAVRMPGLHQADNAGLAVAAAALLDEAGIAISPAGLRRALGRVQLPARVERLLERPRLVVDAAHNAASMQSLCETLMAVEAVGPRVLVFAASSDKQLEEMLAAAVSWADRLVITRYTTNPRAASLDRLLAAVRTAAPSLAATAAAEPDPWRATQLAIRWAGTEGMVCVAGSFFLAAEVRAGVLADREL